MIVPFANKKDVMEIPEQFKSEINFIFVEHLDEVLAIALEEKVLSGAVKRSGTGSNRGGKKSKDSAAASAA